MTANQFLTALKWLEEELKVKLSGLVSEFDNITYKMLVDCLKSEDPLAVKNAIDQLATEGKKMAIPPLYLVTKAHPDAWIRQQADIGLAKLINNDDLNKITGNSDTKDAVRLLIATFGNYRQK